MALSKGDIVPIDNLHSWSESASLLFSFSLYLIDLGIKFKGMFLRESISEGEGDG